VPLHNKGISAVEKELDTNGIAYTLNDIIMVCNQFRELDSHDNTASATL
jgi:hypothetical protein